MMNQPEIHIQSYFSIETDLAEGFSDWSEFIEGKEHDVLLESSDGEKVSTKYIEKIEDEVRDLYMQIKSNRNGPLFQRVLGHATYLLSQHSDSLMVHKWS